MTTVTFSDYSLSVSRGSPSTESTNLGSQIFEKNSRNFQKAKLEFVMLQQLFT